MKRILGLVAGLILVGAGCASAPAENQQQTVNPNNQQQVTQEQPSQLQPVVTQTDPNQNVPAPSNSLPAYTMAQVAANNSAAKCWTVISNSVYDVTNYAPKHPGGKQAVLNTCGRDATADYTKQHGGQAKPEAALEKLKIGTIQ